MLLSLIIASIHDTKCGTYSVNDYQSNTDSNY